MIEEAREIEISIADIWAIIKQYRRLILVTPTACAIAAYILVTFVITAKWEASAIIQVGQVGQLGERQAVPAEPIENAVARANSPSFAASVLSQASLNPSERVAAKDIYEDSIKVNKLKDANLLELKLRGPSPEIARTLAIDTVNHLKQIHDGLMMDNIENLKSELAITNNEIEGIRSETDAQKNQLKGRTFKESYEAIITASLLHEELTSLRELKQKRQLMIERLGLSATFPTRLVGDVSVSTKPVSPKKSFIVTIAILLGLFGGVFVAFFHRALTKNHA